MAVLSARVSALNCGNAVEPISARSLTSEQAGQSGPRSLRTALEKLNAGCSELEVAQWLVDRPLIAGAMIWEMPDGQVLAYPEWSAQQKADLHKAVVDAEAWLKSWTPGTLVEPAELPENLAESILEKHPDEQPFTVWSTADAWARYLDLIAHSLAVERLGLVPWSIADYDIEQLAILLDARYLLIWYDRCRMYSALKTSKFLYAMYSLSGYAVGFHRQFYGAGETLNGQKLAIYATIPTDARYLWSVLRGFIQWGMVGEARRATIVNTLNYLRGGLAGPEGSPAYRGISHALGLPFQAWQYRGGAPVQRSLQGTVSTVPLQPGFAHEVYGCHGAVDVIHYTLRTLNIPVRDGMPEGYFHAFAYFMVEGLYSAGGDDILVATMSEVANVLPQDSEALLIDEQRYKELFVPPIGYSEAQIERVQATPFADAMIKTLPPNLVRHYCCDPNRVMADLKKVYTSQQLQVMGVWDNLAKKATKLGGCDYLKAQGCK